MKVLALISLALFAQAMDFETFESDIYTDFFGGFLTGIGASGTQCQSSVDQFTKIIQQTIQDIESFATTSYLPIVADVTAFKAQIKTVEDLCDLVGLEKQIIKLLGPSGKSIMMKNYIMHTKQVNADIAVVEKCAENYYACGQSAGDLVKIMTGWSLSSRLELGMDATETDIWQMLQGFVETVNWYAPEYCNDAFKMVPKFSEFVQEILGALTGNEEDIKTVIQVVIGLWAEEAVVRDCAMAYGGMALYAIPTALTDMHAWKITYYSETQEVTSALAFITSKCGHNPYTCGVKFGTIVNSLIQASFH